jgi:hypothetical protein
MGVNGVYTRTSRGVDDETRGMERPGTSGVLHRDINKCGKPAFEGPHPDYQRFVFVDRTRRVI